MSSRRTPLLALILGLAPGLVQAQALRSMTVPADATVVIAPRGQTPPPALPRLPPAVSAPAAAPVALAPSAVPLAIGGSTMGLGAGVGLLLPLAAAALFGAGLPGSGGGTSAPSNTR
jgi:hypothetical protein